MWMWLLRLQCALFQQDQLVTHWGRNQVGSSPHINLSEKMVKWCVLCWALPQSFHGNFYFGWESFHGMIICTACLRRSWPHRSIMLCHSVGLGARKTANSEIRFLLNWPANCDSTSVSSHLLPLRPKIAKMPRCSQNLRAWKVSLCRIRSKTSKTKLLAFLRPPSRSIRSSIAFGGRFKCFASCRLSGDFCGTVSAFSIINLLWLCWGGHDLLALVSTDLWLKVAIPFLISSHPAAIETSSHWPIALLGHLHLWCTEATTLTPRSSRTKNVSYNTDFIHNHVE